ncbi:lysophospholipase L1-like esterase [Altererythrobacter atlanticus]|uniref:Multifunctional acyl-CoA thioesterase I and protease I and lysophospholipase L1 n=1 Tax=Croceibacterium atlanticum TaxID=1267766 RepID=A0A0F7KRM2_9SPHN|nr:SGNH/GDSL hydrolase family protein [Croceibacterium atlanticum]AKH41400.1 multifunctional acyl-CoA thioesterase I and protease I and lysophospholipase L1 [Croceibacterium atlanticum]MBB5732862.1 lysophospholipase L1-like esterase [Croceibacterium atlanticum]
MHFPRSAAVFILLAAAFSSPVSAQDRWIESWGTPLPLAPAPPPPFEAPSGEDAPPPPVPSPFEPYPASFDNQTIRMIVRTSAGGDRFRLEFANAQGGEAVTLASVHAALSAGGSALVPGTSRKVTFGGEDELILHPGAKAVSDPVELALPALAEVAISIHLPHTTTANTVDPLALMPTYVVDGDRAAAERMDDAQITGSYFWLKGLSVPARQDAATIVALGDSITEGYATTAGAHASWPALLAERLQKDPELSGWGVVNAGISGNRVLRTGAGDAAIARFGDDVIGRPGVKWVIILEGINDINMSIMPGMAESQATTAEEIIAGLDQLVARAHLHGIKVAGGTILPTRGLPFYSAEGEAMRRTVNDWIRNSGRFDAVIDFDAATRDRDDPLRLLPEIDPGDHVHPNDRGNMLMANAIDLGIFKLDQQDGIAPGN